MKDDDEKTNITLINMSPPYGMNASTLKLAASRLSSSVLQVLVCEKEILLQDLLIEEALRGTEEKVEAKPIEGAFLKTVFDASHTVILPDSVLTDRSRVFYSELFLKHGMDALVEFYKNGGNVIIMVMEGFFSVDALINERFGTQWKIQFFEVGSCSVTPTETAKTILGPFLPKSPLLKDNPYFIDCPKGEGLYQPILQNKEQFVESFHAQDIHFERLGIEKDESMDCFNVEKSWEKYLERYTDRYCMAVHEGTGTEGTIIWYGDRGQSETMAFVFCKLLNYERKNRESTASSTGGKGTTAASTSPFSTFLESFKDIQITMVDVTVVVSFLVVLMAILVQLMGASLKLKLWS